MPGERLYPIELEDVILARLENGESLRKICKAEGFPHESTVRKWARMDPEFMKKYRAARDLGYETLADELIDICDDATNDWMERNDPENPGYQVNLEHIARARLRIDTRKWVLAKMHPQIYGDKQQVDVSGTIKITRVMVDDEEPAHIEHSQNGRMLPEVIEGGLRDAGY